MKFKPRMPAFACISISLPVCMSAVFYYYIADSLSVYFSVYLLDIILKDFFLNLPPAHLWYFHFAYAQRVLFLSFFLFDFDFSFPNSIHFIKCQLFKRNPFIRMHLLSKCDQLNILQSIYCYRTGFMHFLLNPIKEYKTWF